MELALDRHDDGPEFARVNKRLKDKDGRPIVIAADNPILDTRMYEVEYADGYKTAMAANAIESNLFSQVDQDGQHFYIIQRHHRFVYRRHTDQGGRLFYPYVQWNKRRRETTKVWEVCIQWKDGSST